MTLTETIDQTAARLVGPDRAAQKKLRLFVGVAAIVLANTLLGPVIGHAIAALLGVGVFFLLLDTRKD